MNERLTTRGLAELLARQTGMEAKRAEDFIDALSSYISQSIERNKVVKIMGLGTFKIVLVRERESVHIQTGERFVIPTHHKLSFVPDKDFKDQINRPFAFFEPIEAIDGNDPKADKPIEVENKTPKKVTFIKETVVAETVASEPEKTVSSVAADAEASEAPEKPLADASVENASDEEIVPKITDDPIVPDEYEVVYPDDNEYEEVVAEPEPTEPEFDFSEIEETPELIAEEIVEEYEEISEEETDKEPEPASIADDAEYEEETSQESEIDDSQMEPIYLNVDNREPEPVDTYRIEPEQAQDPKQESEKKKKTTPLWLWFFLLPILIVAGVGAGTYAFWMRNTTDKANHVLVSKTGANDTNHSPLPIGAVSTTATGEEKEEGVSIQNLADQLLGTDEATNDSTVGDTNKNEADGSNVAGENDTNAQEAAKKEERQVIDWLAPSPENSTPRTEVKRADKPNKEIEERNKNLANNTAKTNASTTQKPATANNNAQRPASTTTAARSGGSTSTTAGSAKKIPAKVRMTAGSSLTQVAMEYYGNTIFWVYIYEHNKSRIPNFNNVPVGTEITLPSPKTYGIDAKNEKSVQKAREKQRQLLKWDNWDEYR